MLRRRNYDAEPLALHPDSRVNLPLFDLLLESHALANEDTRLLPSGVLLAMTGEFTGRSPKDKYIVNNGVSGEVDWNINQKIHPDNQKAVRQSVQEFVSSHPTYVYEGWIVADDRHRRRVRVVSEYAWHAAFAKNLFVGEIQPDPHEPPDLTIYALPSLEANPSLHSTRTGTYVGVDLHAGEVLILGTEYAGEIKKSAFTFANYIFPREGILPMHCSANIGENGDVTLFFGLSGTGKTTLSADANRRLIGDDEHIWHDDGVSNIEGGCYAKVINLDANAEPQIWKAINSPGSILENVALNNGKLDFADGKIENTRGAYDLSLIENAETKGWVEAMPKNIVFLTCDAFGVLPPVSRLSVEQAGEHFLHGYTAVVAGTERGATEPTPKFSACFGEPFLVHPPQVYADLLMKKIQESGAKVWLVNTGWSGGPAGQADRMKIETSRAIIDAIHSEDLDNVLFEASGILGLEVPTFCPGLEDQSILQPQNAWKDKQSYQTTAAYLERLFEENKKKLLRNSTR